MKRLEVALATGTLLACALALTTLADDALPGQVVRNIVARHDQSGVPGKEILIGTADFPAGGSVGFHTHPGDEAGYVIRGSVTLKTQGQPDRRLEAGDTFFNVRGAVHSVLAGAEGASVVSSWILDKGAPMATPVP